MTEKCLKIRFVKPFTIAAFQKCTRVFPPPKLDVFEERNVPTSVFRMLFLRGDIPCHRSFNRSRHQKPTLLMWKVAPEDLDYSYYLPIFFDGLCESVPPYNFIARYGIHDLLSAASGKILPVISRLVIPIRNALCTRNCNVIMATLRVIQHMCFCEPCVAVKFNPHYRQFLPTLNLFVGRDNVNTLGRIDYDRVGRLGDEIEKTLMILERCGGEETFVQIKSCIPTYEGSYNWQLLKEVELRK